MTCSTCDGSGELRGRYAVIECPTCHGTGQEPGKGSEA